MKKFISLICAFAMVFACSVSVFANDFEDRVEAYKDFKEKAFEKGLTESEIKALFNRGFSYADILKMETSQIRRILPFSGTRALTYVRPNNYIGIIMTEDDFEPGVPQYFHPNTGLNEGDFYDDNNGEQWDSAVENFIKNVYNRSNTNGFTYHYYYWGEWDDYSRTHQGHDMYSASATGTEPIRSLHSGIVTIDSNYGAVLIYNSAANRTFIYAHMRNLQVGNNDSVSVGQIIGYEGDVSPTTISKHLHFEVALGNVTSLGSQGGLNRLNPYSYMYNLPWGEYNNIIDDIM